MVSTEQNLSDYNMIMLNYLMLSQNLTEGTVWKPDRSQFSCGNSTLPQEKAISLRSKRVSFFSCQ
jgi:hypothetical protein